MARAPYKILSFDSPDELALAAAANWLTSILVTPGDDPISIALPGGRITTSFLAAITSHVTAKGLPLDRVHFYWGDERCVPPDSKDSNYRLAFNQLFDPLQINPANVHRIKGEMDPGDATTEASKDVRDTVPMKNGQPVFDWIILGMGEDGHTASLFPEESEADRNRTAVYRPVTTTKPPPQRITLGYPAIAAAKNVWVLASGSGKETALRESIVEGGTTPLARVLQSRDETLIYTDI